MAETQRILRGTLADIAAKVAAARIERTAVILVGRALAAEDFRDSALYDPDYRRRFRGGAGLRCSRRGKRRAANQGAVAVKQHDLDRHVTTGDHALRGLPCRTGDCIAERDAFSARQSKGFRRGVGRDDARSEFLRSAGGANEIRKQRAIDFAALGMQIGAGPARAWSFWRRRRRW